MPVPTEGKCKAAKWAWDVGTEVFKSAGSSYIENDGKVDLKDVGIDMLVFGAGKGTDFFHYNGSDEFMKTGADEFARDASALFFRQVEKAGGDAVKTGLDP